MGKIWRKGQNGICLEEDVKRRKARSYISKIQKNKDDKNDNENNLTVFG